MHHTYDDTEMATIRRSGSGWQVLIRRKNYVGPKSKTFLSRDLAESWADAVDERTKKVFRDIPITLGEAINDYINQQSLIGGILQVMERIKPVKKFVINF